MSKYTTEVRFICEQNAGLSDSEGANSINDIIAKSREKIFDFSFPMFDENYRATLETKILKHYYTREIGFETVGLWKHFLDMRLNEIMPYYNQLYKSETIEFNPMYDFESNTTSNRKLDHDETTTDHNTRTDNLSEDVTSQNTRTNNLAHSDMTTSSLNHTDAYSDTPQGGLSNVNDLTYLTNYRHINESTSENNNGTNTGTVENNGNGNTKNTGTQDNDGNGTRNIDTTDEYIEHVAGKRNGMSYSKMLQEYRDTFLNIDMMIIKELNDLFLNLW